MLVNPINMMNEAIHLQEIGVPDIFRRTTVDERCLIVTPFQKAVNRILRHNRHNTCGQGVGQTRSDHFLYGPKVLFAGDLSDKATVKDKLRFIQERCQGAIGNYGIVARKMCPDSFEWLFDPDGVDKVAKLYMEIPIQVVPRFHFGSRENILFEGAQGILLDERHGDIGFNTWTNTTFENALTLLAEAGWNDRITKIGVIRTYLTRHGAGPFRTEDPKLDHIPEPHNCEGCYQGKFRRGRFDAKLVARAIEIAGGVDGIALNHCDVLPYFNDLEVKIKRQYEYPPVVIRGHGPSAKHREWTI
jgi:adenylosuccinate synthase